MRASRLPSINTIHTSGDNFGSGRSRVRCPTCDVALVWDGLKINNYFCPACGYELETAEQRQQRLQQEQQQSPYQQQQQEQHEEIKNEFPDLEMGEGGYIVTVDGFSDVGNNKNKTNDTARFRPVDSPRATSRGVERWTSPTAKELSERGYTITGSWEDVGDSGVFLDSSANRRYKNVGRRPPYSYGG